MGLITAIGANMVQLINVCALDKISDRAPVAMFAGGSSVVYVPPSAVTCIVHGGQVA